MVHDSNTMGRPALKEVFKQHLPTYEELSNPRLFLSNNYTSVLMFFFFIGVAIFQFKKGFVGLLSSCFEPC